MQIIGLFLALFLWMFWIVHLPHLHFLMFPCYMVLNSEWIFFLGEILLFLLPRARAKFPFLGKGWWKGEILARRPCRKAGHDVCQCIGLASGSGIRECPTSFPWHSCNNDDLEIHEKLVMHAPMWTLKHQVLWLCDTRAQDSFFLFKSTQCFQNMLLYQFMHSFGSILGVREKFTAFTL